MSKPLTKEDIDEAVHIWDSLPHCKRTFSGSRGVAVAKSSLTTKQMGKRLARLIQSAGPIYEKTV